MKLLLNLENDLAVLLSTLGANSVMEIVSAAVGALFQSGLFQFPYAGASGILSCFGCFTLRYCHVSTSPFFLHRFRLNFFNL